MEKTHSENGATSITFLDLAIILAKRKRIVFGLPFLAGLVALACVLLLPKVYTGTARILPPQQKESSAAAMLGALAGVVGPTNTALGQAFGLRNPNDLYAGILRGRTIADRLIEKFKLKDLYETETMVDTRKALENVTKITAGKDGLITIEVEDKDPQRSADLANAYVEELDRLMQGLAVTEASQRRLFFEKQLASTQDKLVAAEIALRQSIEAKGIAGVDAQTRALVSTSEQLRAQIAVKEIQLDAMRAFATEHNPEAMRLRQELASMRTELGKLEGGRPAGAQHSPAGLQNLRKLREMKFLEFTVELLTKQYEIAKIDEAKDAVLIQVVDKAVPLDSKSKPKRAVILAVSVLIAGFLAVVIAFIAELLHRMRIDVRTASQIQMLREYLRWR